MTDPLSRSCNKYDCTCLSSSSLNRHGPPFFLWYFMNNHFFPGILFSFNSLRYLSLHVHMLFSYRTWLCNRLENYFTVAATVQLYLNLKNARMCNYTLTARAQKYLLCAHEHWRLMTYKPPVENNNTHYES